MFDIISEEKKTCFNLPILRNLEKFVNFPSLLLFIPPDLSTFCFYLSWEAGVHCPSFLALHFRAKVPLFCKGQMAQASGLVGHVIILLQLTQHSPSIAKEGTDNKYSVNTAVLQ